jgi:pimeloyl-ACP methyl ester carboxylesterase
MHASTLGAGTFRRCHPRVEPVWLGREQRFGHHHTPCAGPTGGAGIDHHCLVDLPADLSSEEQEYVRSGHRWQAEEGGYLHEQSTKPQTLAVGLSDSPAGLAAWILEKLRNWTDCDGDVGSVFTRDELLTWISAYWFSGCIGTSFTPYAAGGDKSWPRIQAPAAFTVFPRDLVNAPRAFADRFFTVTEWTEPTQGGHFAAWEQPDDYLSGIHSAIRLSRSTV